MLEFLKKIFKNEEEKIKEIREINLQSLEEWLGEKSKPLMEDINQHIQEILMKVDEEVQKSRVNVEVLENAKLQNPNIPFKAKQYMEGNRKAYIRAINSFLGQMEINNNNYFYLLDFCKQFDGLLTELNKSTLRSYTILQEFFANETNKIAQSLKNFDNLFKDLKSVLNNDMINVVNDTIVKIQGLKTKMKHKINLDVDFKGIEAEIKLANDEKNAMMSDIEKFSNSNEHNNFQKLNEDKKNKLSAFYNDENQLMQSFSVLERPLRKYSRIVFEHEEEVLEYLKQPIETLVDDKGIIILEILKNLEKLLREGTLQLDDKRIEKSLEEIKKLDKQFIEQFLKKHSSFKAEIEDLENKIKATGVAEKLRDFNKKLEDINFRIEKITEEYNKLKNDVVKFDNAIANLKSEIEGSIRNIFEEEVMVII